MKICTRAFAGADQAEEAVECVACGWAPHSPHPTSAYDCPMLDCSCFRGQRSTTYPRRIICPGSRRRHPAAPTRHTRIAIRLTSKRRSETTWPADLAFRSIPLHSHPSLRCITQGSPAHNEPFFKNLFQSFQVRIFVFFPKQPPLFFFVMLRTKVEIPESQTFPLALFFLQIFWTLRAWLPTTNAPVCVA